MKIALIQQHATQDREENLERGVKAFREAAENGAELVAYAELGFLPFLPQSRATPESPSWAEPIPGPTTEIFGRLAKEYGAVAVLNIFERDGDNTYDASPVIDADGSLLGVTRMVHVMDGMGVYEKDYYTPPGDENKFVFQTKVGRVGVSICYDRHFPEYMRNLALLDAELVVIPQAGALGEWTEGVFEAELQVAAFQNGYYTALVNRVGKEEVLHFAGESFVVDPDGRVLSRAPLDKDTILYTDIDLSTVKNCTARKYFLRDRRPEIYPHFKLWNS
ncbi:MAG: carbon-nitrogen hydrolase family protein [Candidatus Aminicenantes bacterium]|nr:carbon-nitrogen hydrolase family protein [Candidatus Aminicenantes bacterium]